MRLRRLAAALLAVALAGCASTRPGAPDLPTLPKLAVTSPAYAEGGAIPAESSCDGADRSPPWAFAGVPKEARFLAAVFDDPDAPRGTWTHWTWWDLPASVTSLPAGADVARLGATEGTTSAKEVGYHGPCPPGGTHRYVLHLYATKEPLGLPGARPSATCTPRSRQRPSRKAR